MAGFGPHQVMHTAKIELLTEHLPIRIEFVETAEKVDELLPTVYDMVSDGLIEVQDTNIVKAAMKDRPAEPKPAHEKKQGKAKMLRIYIGEGDQWNGEPLYDAIVKQLRMMNISGATVYRGILGYGAKGHTHKEHFLHISRDLPVMIAVVETEDKLNQAMGTIESMIQDGLIVTSDVEIVRLVRGQPPVEVPDATEPPR
jgi:PII-like signaling protein